MSVDLRKVNQEFRDAARERESIDCSKPVEVPELAIGTGWAQGDLLIERIRRMPKKATRIEMPQGGKMAPGDTEGSNHRIAHEHRSLCRIYEANDGDMLSDYIVEASGAWRLEHPVHPDCTFRKGCYRIHHQQNELMMRQLD